MIRASVQQSLSLALSSIRQGPLRSCCLSSWSLLCASSSLLPLTPSDMEQAPRERVTMDAACSVHPARISQLLLHPHPYETSTGSCDDSSSAVTKPIIINGENEEQHTVCVADESGVYSPVQGKTLACARQCCLFFSQNQE